MGLQRIRHDLATKQQRPIKVIEPRADVSIGVTYGGKVCFFITLLYIIILLLVLIKKHIFPS